MYVVKLAEKMADCLPEALHNKSVDKSPIESRVSL